MSDTKPTAQGEIVAVAVCTCPWADSKRVLDPTCPVHSPRVASSLTPIPAEERAVYYDALRAGRAEAERLGYGAMDDRIFGAFWRVIRETHTPVVADRDAQAEKVKALRSQLNEIKDVVGWFEPGDEKRAVQLRDQIWDLVQR